MHHRDGRFVLRILQIGEEGPQLSHQEHSLVDDSPAGKGHHVRIVIALLEDSPHNVKPAVKIKALLHIRGLFDKGLHDAGHTFPGLMPQHLRNRGHSPPSQQLHALLLHNNLKHLACLVALQLILGEEEHADSIFPLSAQKNTEGTAGSGKKLVGNL